MTLRPGDAAAQQTLRPAGGYRILRSMVGGERTEADFGIRLQNPVVGHLKLGWRFDPRPHEWRNSWERDDG